MKFRLRQGEEVDVLNAAELAAQIDRLVNALATPRKLVKTRIRKSARGTLDGSGDALVEVYTVPPNMEFRLCRVRVDADGHSYAAPFTNASGGVDIQREGQGIDGFNLAAGIPNAWGASADSAHVLYRGGEQVGVLFAGGPADTGVTVHIEGNLYSPATRPSR